MRLAKRFRKNKVTSLQKANEKKNAKRMASNLAIIKAAANA